MSGSYDFEPSRASWFARAYHTPVRDALRGRLSGRLDVRQEIVAAQLPGPLAGLVYTVVRRTRLWRSEKCDVARELIAHFADGLAAGRTAEQLAADFGSREQAARLIRKAKRRNRHWLWHCYRYGLLTMGLVVVGYALLIARFYFARPEVVHNYWHDINAARRGAEVDRAWPLYRTAALKVGKLKIPDEPGSGPGPQWLADGPAGKHWGEVLMTLDRHRESLELAREGAKKPKLGFFAGDRADLDAARAAQAAWLMSDDAPLADENRDLGAMDLGGMTGLRKLAWLLAADARRAAVDGDAATAVADLTAIISMSEQIFQPQTTLVEQLVGIAVFNLALDTCGRLLAESPQIFSDAQLRDLAHRIAGYRDGAITLDLATERMWFDDLLQRVYTDDGRGGGRLTPEGVVLLLELGTVTNELWKSMVRVGQHSKQPALLLHLLGPGMTALVGDRADNHRFYNVCLDDSIAAHQGPAWLWDLSATEAVDKRLDDIRRHPTQKLRYVPALLFLPAVGALFQAGERTIQLRDAAEVPIALELWHRRHGEWPASLAQLVPDLLPAVPPDRFDGQPLRYAVRDGRPVLYSIGTDRNDDGGRPTANPWSAITGFGPVTPESLTSFQQTPDMDGDWVLWPPFAEKRDE